MKTPLLFIFLSLMLYGHSAVAQETSFSGSVTDENGNPLPAVNIIVSGTTQGTTTGPDGDFMMTASLTQPFTIEVSSLGFQTQRVAITADGQVVSVTLMETADILDEIVISASRTPERIFESPVSVERLGIREVRSAATPSFYSGIENLKGVDLNTNSLTFQSVNTRGFATFANTRFVQLVDGADNASPALNFVLGNLIGLSELDVESVELLPGASSALYGANAFNGILFMNSKSPFDHEGISFYYKEGLTSQAAAGDNRYYDYGIRLAHKFTDHFAAKLNFTYMKGTDWHAVSEVDVLNPGRDRNHPNYDGLNIYGDEVSTNIRVVGEALADMELIPPSAVNLLPDEDVSRTGYHERDLTDYKARSIKFDGALHFRPWANDIEGIYAFKIGLGNTIYQGANRYSLRNFVMQQHKLELRSDRFFLRGYLTDETAGNSYDMRFTGINVNRTWKPDEQWFGEYAGAYIQASMAGADYETAHTIARQEAETGRYEPGTPEFREAFNTVISDPDLEQGSRFKDGTQLRHIEGNYNFSHMLDDAADVQVGASFREYRLNSSGTIFTDYDEPIPYNEIGAYAQLQKKLSDERLKLTGSIRFDKSELFDPFFSPRLSVGYTAGEDRNHNIRGSFQTGFRNPTTQDLFIGLDVGRAILVGSAERNLDRYERTFPVSAAGAAATGSEEATISGRDAYENAFSLHSVEAGMPEAADVDLVKPERVTNFEVGYRGRLGKITIDAAVYYNIYKDFISNETVIVPLYGEVGDGTLSLLALQQGDFRAFQTYTNSPADVKSYGAVLGVGASVFDNFYVDVNYTYAEQDFDQASAPDFRTSFNTPNHRIKASLGSDGVTDSGFGQNLGFGINYRWSDSFFWEASFADGYVPSFSVVDAQINYQIEAIKSVLKIGGANIGSNEYFTAFGTGLIGQMYYVSLTFNN